MGTGALDSGSSLGGLGGLRGELAVSARESRVRSDQEMFSEILAQARTNPGDTPEMQARKAAEQLVSTALVQPIFKRLRDSNNAAAPFAPNQAERTFGAMRDAALAQRMVGSQRWALVDQLARRMLAKVPGKAVTA